MSERLTTICDLCDEKPCEVKAKKIIESGIITKNIDQITSLNPYYDDILLSCDYHSPNVNSYWVFTTAESQEKLGDVLSDRQNTEMEIRKHIEGLLPTLLPEGYEVGIQRRSK
jgi:hypothetical protein